MRIPFRLLVQPGQVKPCLTSTFQDLIPQQLRQRPKAGFMVPLDRWFRSESKGHGPRHATCRQTRFAISTLPGLALERLLADHASGSWSNGDRIWSLLFLELWGRQATAAVASANP